MSTRSLDFDRDGDSGYDDGPGAGITPPRIGDSSKTENENVEQNAWFSWENPGFVLVLWNFLLALPLAYTLTLLIQHFTTAFGFTTLSPLLSRGVFVAVNMWFIVGWGLQLEKEARGRKERRVERMKEEVMWWESEVRRLEGLLGGVRQKEVEDQLRRESPGAASRGTERSAMLYGAGTVRGTPTASVASLRRGTEGMDREVDGDLDVDVLEEEDTEEEVLETDYSGSGSDGEWNGVDRRGW
ncbi:hypothetical protein VTL71DRAFT_411 [Oculimacula yallundae]|uniref:Uncharacterized protein n=1 Tax=Oculimacula yallundae TaxID=86028 RepID=A0ABR4CZX8_9HELO